MSTPLFNAIRNGETEKVTSLLKENPEWVSEKDARGSTPLLLATYYGFEEMTQVILQYSQNVDLQDASGNTALMGVCFKGYENIAQLLIQNGAQVNAKN